MTDSVYDKLRNCYDNIKDEIPFELKVALVLGSDPGNYTEQLKIQGTINYRDIGGFPVPTIPGHEDKFVFARINGVPAVLVQGRVHYCGGYSTSDVILPACLIKLMGVKILFLTNITGRVDYDCGVGDFVLIKSQISYFVPSPSIRPNPEELGSGSPDMSHVYDKGLRDIVRFAVLKLGIRIQEGVYVRLAGPIYESPYEVEMCKILGGGTIGMSTACEAVATNHMGMEMCGISRISNLACGMTDTPLSHQEVQEVPDRMAPLFKKLVSESIKKMESI